MFPRLAQGILDVWVSNIGHTREEGGIQRDLVHRMIAWSRSHSIVQNFSCLFTLCFCSSNRRGTQHSVTWSRCVLTKKLCKLQCYCIMLFWSRVYTFTTRAFCWWTTKWFYQKRERALSCYHRLTSPYFDGLQKRKPFTLESPLAAKVKNMVMAPLS